MRMGAVLIVCQNLFEFANRFENLLRSICLLTVVFHVENSARVSSRAIDDSKVLSESEHRGQSNCRAVLMSLMKSRAALKIDM